MSNEFAGFLTYEIRPNQEVKIEEVGTIGCGFERIQSCIEELQKDDFNVNLQIYQRNNELRALVVGIKDK